VKQRVVPRFARDARLDGLTLCHEVIAEAVEAQSVGFNEGLSFARGLSLELRALQEGVLSLARGALGGVRFVLREVRFGGTRRFA